MHYALKRLSLIRSQRSEHGKFTNPFPTIDLFLKFSITFKYVISNIANEIVSVKQAFSYRKKSNCVYLKFKTNSTLLLSKITCEPALYAGSLFSLV